MLGLIQKIERQDVINDESNEIKLLGSDRRSCRMKTKPMILIGLLLPSLSHAQSIEGIMSRTITYLQGGLARTIGVFCIIIAGYLCLALQKFPKEYFVMILVGMGMIYGGTSLYSTLIG